jgi:hypothetical protein
MRAALLKHALRFRHLVQLATMLLALALDVLRFLGHCLRPHPTLAAEQLFVREQLALFHERGVRPRRTTDATRRGKQKPHMVFTLYHEPCHSLILSQGSHCEKTQTAIAGHEACATGRSGWRIGGPTHAIHPKMLCVRRPPAWRHRDGCAQPAPRGAPTPVALVSAGGSTPGLPLGRA